MNNERLEVMQMLATKNTTLANEVERQNKRILELEEEVKRLNLILSPEKYNALYERWDSEIKTTKERFASEVEFYESYEIEACTFICLLTDENIEKLKQ